MTSEDNQEKNRVYYEKLYENYPINNILIWLNDLENFLATNTTTELSWVALYWESFQNKLKGKKVLEMGCGDCVNASVMASLGAEVYANDLASASGEIIRKVNENFEFDHPIKFVPGDFLKNDLPESSFDFVVGKAFLHHLTLPVEKLFLNETARLLKPGGEARFVEPAVNSKILDEVRWHIPVRNRPSKFQKEAFAAWKANDPHPERCLSSGHFEKVGEELFEEIKIVPFGTLERFSRFFRWGEKQRNFKRWALRNEKYIPANLNKFLTRTQLIIYKKANAF